MEHGVGQPGVQGKRIPSIQTIGAPASARQLGRTNKARAMSTREVKGQKGQRDPAGSSRLWTLGQKGLFTERPWRSRPRPGVNH